MWQQGFWALDFWAEGFWFEESAAPPADVFPVAGPRVVPQRKARRDRDDDVLLFILG